MYGKDRGKGEKAASRGGKMGVLESQDGKGLRAGRHRPLQGLQVLAHRVCLAVQHGKGFKGYRLCLIT